MNGSKPYALRAISGLLGKCQRGCTASVSFPMKPTKGPPGFGLRQSPGAFRSGGDARAAEDCRSPRRYRDRRTFLQRFMVPMHAEKRKRAPHEPARPLTPALSLGERVRVRGIGLLFDTE